MKKSYNQFSLDGPEASTDTESLGLVVSCILKTWPHRTKVIGGKGNQIICIHLKQLTGLYPQKKKKKETLKYKARGRESGM